jgi:hypothetical protein
MHSCRDVVKLLDTRATAAGSLSISHLLYPGKQLRNMALFLEPWRTVGLKGFIPRVANAAQTSIAHSLREKLQVTS